MATTADSIDKTSASTPQAKRAYTPKQHIIYDPELRALAQQTAPQIFAWLVNEVEAARFAPSPMLDYLTRVVGTREYKDSETGEIVSRPGYDAYKFVVDVARKVVRGEKSMREIDFGRVVMKNGEFNQWVFRMWCNLEENGFPVPALN